MAAHRSLFLRLTALLTLAIGAPFVGSAWFASREVAARVESEAERRGEILAAFAASLVEGTLERASNKLSTLARLAAEGRPGGALGGPELPLATDALLLESQVEPAGLFLQLQSFDAAAAAQPLNQVQQAAQVQPALDNFLRAQANRDLPAVREPLASGRPWRASDLERLGEDVTLVLSAIDRSRRRVLVGYVDFGELRDALARACEPGQQIEVVDGNGTSLAKVGEVDGEVREQRLALGSEGWSVRVREARAAIDEPLARQRRQFLVFGALGLLLAVAAGAWIASWIARPILRLRHAAERMSSGDFGARSGVVGDDEIGRLGRAFDRMAADFERLDQAKNAFVGNVGHELRTPLTSLRLGIENLLEGLRGPLSADQHATLARVHTDLGRLSAMVDDLLFLARLQAGAAAARPEPCELRSVLTQAIEPWITAAQARSISIELRGEGRATIDATLFTRAISNLVDNAIRHSPDGGRVEVEFDARGVRVMDRGAGFDDPRLFERFAQGEHDGVKSKGVGLGLSIAREALAASGARVDARLRDGGGSVFEVFLAEDAT